MHLQGWVVFILQACFSSKAQPHPICCTDGDNTDTMLLCIPQCVCPSGRTPGPQPPSPPTVWNTKASFSGHSQWCSGMSVPRYYCLKDTFWVFISSFYKCQLYIFDLSPLNACLLPSISIHSMLWILSSLVTQPFFFGIQVNWETSLPNVGFELSKKRNRLQK